MHADAARSQLVRQIAAGRLQRRLHRPHDVVVGHHLVCAVIAHRKQRAAIGHQRRRQFRHAHKGMAGHIDRLQEAVQRAVEQAALHVRLGRVAMECTTISSLPCRASAAKTSSIWPAC
ncbi:conserved hypothetical protein, partial [Ricinus communis]